MPQQPRSDPNYQYGPPTTVGTGPEDSGTPQDNSDAVTVDADQGESPLAPPPDAATITEPGGSPTDEVLELHDPKIESLTPTLPSSVGRPR